MSPIAGSTTGGAPGRRVAMIVALALCLYAGALALWRDQIPQGIHNDTVEEAQRGLYLVEGRHFEVITFVIGNSAETLYLYLVGAAIGILGPTTLAIQSVSWIFAIAAIALGIWLVRCLEPVLPVWVAILLCTSSLWLLHYARAGLRAIAAPVVLLAFALLLDRAGRDADPRAPALGAGAVLGLGVYAYTSCRVLVLVWLVYAVVRLLRSSSRAVPLRTYVWIAIGAALVSIPNLVFILGAPREFFFRGSYVVRGTLIDWLGHLVWTFLLPFHYPELYRLAVGPAHFTDGVSTSLKLAGLNPIHPLVGAAFVVGLARAWRRRVEPVPAFMLCAWIVGSLVLGFSGPSLTRLLMLLPVYLVLAALGIAALFEWAPRSRPAVSVLLLLVLATTGYDYFVAFARNPAAQYVYSQAATPIGMRAAVLAREGNRVVAVVSKDFNTVRYLIHDHSDAVRVVEFYRQPLDPRKLKLAEFQPHVLLLERNERFAAFANALPADRRVGTHPAYDEFHLDRRP